ncbi:hypothetical protein OA511_03270 [Prochlorococcus sp. AH-716-J09]|nr:hypothetical protein [Prochlorococcus sp. AH-716-J09]
MSNYSSEFNIVQVLLKAREILFQQIAYLTERQEVHANKIVNLEAEVDYLKSQFKSLSDKNHEDAIREWLSNQKVDEDEIIDDNQDPF